MKSYWYISVHEYFCNVSINCMNSEILLNDPNCVVTLPNVCIVFTGVM